LPITAGKVISVLEEWAPPQIQAQWDNSGLQVGDGGWAADKILLALDITPEVMEYAAAHNYNFLLSHHPLIFHKLARVTTASPVGKIIATALNKQITVYSAHTNLDVIQGGVSDVLAQLLGLQDVDVLDRQKGNYFKLAVFVPAPALDRVRKAVGDAGAGSMGNYSHCTFAAAGQGQFCPGAGAKPWLGQQDVLEEVQEYKLESLVEGHLVNRVLAAMREAHPYEEIAYDLFPMEIPAAYGLGRIGTLPAPLNLDALAISLARALDCRYLRICGEDDLLIKKVAVCGGSGSDFVRLAQRRGADVLVTGDVGHHSALEAQQSGLALIDAGHYSSEVPVLAAVKTYLEKMLPGINIAQYPGNTDPMYIKTNW